MGKVLAGITISVDGFITGPGGPGRGLGVGGERLHCRVFGGPWSYNPPGREESAGQDKARPEETMGASGSGWLRLATSSSDRRMAMTTGTTTGAPSA